MAEKEKDEVYEVGQVATQTAPVIVKGDEHFSVEQALAKCLNDLEALKKGLL